MRKLRGLFLAFFVLLAVPCAILLWKAYGNLEREAFTFYRRSAESAAAAFERDFVRRLAREEARPFTQYRYIHVAEPAVPEREGLNLSPLAAFPVASEFPGVLGYFQIDPDGSLRTPLLPDGDYAESVEVADRQARLEVRDRIAALLDQDRFRSWSRAPLGQTRTKAETDTVLRRNLAGLVDSSLEDRYSRQDAAARAQTPGPRPGEETSSPFPRQLQKSSPLQSEVFDADAAKRGAPAENREHALDALSPLEEPAAEGEPAARAERSRDSAREADQEEATAEVDPFQAVAVGDQWLVFHRKVWWRQRRYIQGFALRTDALLEELLAPALTGAALPDGWSGLLFHLGRPVRTLGRSAAGGEKPTLLYESDLPHPLQDWHLAVAVPETPGGPGLGLVHLLAGFIAALLVGGVFGMYRLSASQLELSQKKSDFVAAVSHELKTPLASIRMYGEMLMEGWVDDERKRQTYYRHIHDESQRLSRLIQNVLRLAELERDEWRVQPVQTDSAEFLRGLAERLRRQVENAGFELDVEAQPDAGQIRVDPDALTQIMVNLIDNAIKFGRDAEVKRIQLAVGRSGDQCAIRVRDFGPGIPRGQLKRIFDKFYRVDAEMTRKTRGTGIGLALVKMLAEAMGGKAEAFNRRPGAEFVVTFPCASGA